MKKHIIFLALFSLVAAAFLIMPATSQATDTVTVVRTIVQQPTPSMKGVEKLTFTFSSDDGEVARAAGTAIAGVIGTIEKFHYIPDGTNTPDAGADIRLYSSLTGGIDLFYGACDNVGATETVGFPASGTTYRAPFMAGDTLYFYAGSLGTGTNAGILYVWILNP